MLDEGLEPGRTKIGLLGGCLLRRGFLHVADKEDLLARPLVVQLLDKQPFVEGDTVLSCFNGFLVSQGSQTILCEPLAQLLTLIG